MSLTYADIAPFLVDGKPLEAVAAELAASGLTVRDIPVPALRTLLNVESGLVAIDPVTGNKSGPLIDLYNAAETPAELKDGIAKLFLHLADPTAVAVRTSSRPEYAQLWKTIIGLLPLAAEQLAEINDLHGGEKFAGLTAQPIRDAIDAKDRETRYQNAVMAAQFAYASGQDDTAIKAAFTGAMG